MRSGASTAVLACALSLALAARAAAPGQAPARDPLRALRTAMGGEAWARAGVIEGYGRKTGFGLEGGYRSEESLSDGRFFRGANFGAMANAEGLDAAGRWRMDNSGGVHPLDSPEAMRTAVTEAWLARRGYLRPADAPAVAISPGRDEFGTFDRVRATPRGGQAVDLWLDRKDHRLAKAVMERSSRVETWRFTDYRRQAGLWLPFRIETENGDQSESGVAEVTRYEILPAGTEDVRARPAARRDWTLAAPVAATPLVLDGMSGFPLVRVSLDGSRPRLFILDTGGHDILTPATAAALGLKTFGAGFSLGAGTGASRTRYAIVERAGLGGFEMRDQPFLVLERDLGQAMASDGRAEPIAGIIGLELFERVAAVLDFPGRELRLCAFESARPAPGPVLRFSDDLPLVEAAVDGRRGWFQFDTGNNLQPIVFAAWVRAQGLAPVLAGSGGRLDGAGVGGAVSFARARAAALEFAGRTYADQEVLLAGKDMGALSGRAEAGNLGVQLLAPYVVSLDYRREHVALDAPPARGVCG